MRTYDEISEMLFEIAPKLELAHVTSLEEMDSWSLGMGDETDDALTIDYDATSRKLFLSAEIGAVPEEQAHRFFEFFLQYNLLWAETGGVRMALEKPGGALIQIADLPLADLNADELGRAVDYLFVTARQLRALIARGLGDEEASAPVAESLARMSGAIRA